MKQLDLALKRTLRPGFVLLLAVLVLVTLGAGMAGNLLSLRPCGFVCEDGSREAQAIAAALEQKGFVQYPDAAAMEAGISDGSLDCGAVLRDGIGAAAQKNRLNEMVEMRVSPMSFLQELYQAQLHATLFTFSSPARTVQAGERVGITMDQGAVEGLLEDYFGGGYRFSFTMETIDGGTPSTRRTGQQLQQAAAALLLLAILLPGMERAVDDAEKLRPRIGSAAAFRNILLPMVFWCLLLCWAAACAAMGIRHAAALAGYCLAIAGLGLLLAQLPVRIPGLLPGMLLGSLALYPVYYDLAEVWDGFRILRWFFPACWLSKLLELPLLAAAGAVSLLAGLVLSRMRGSYDRIS